MSTLDIGSDDSFPCALWAGRHVIEEKAGTMDIATFATYLNKEAVEGWIIVYSMFLDVGDD